MNQLRVDDRFSNALEAELVARVQRSSRTRIRRRLRLWLSAGALAGAGLLAGIGAAAAGFFVLPGTEQVTPFEYGSLVQDRSDGLNQDHPRLGGCL